MELPRGNRSKQATIIPRKFQREIGGESNAELFPRNLYDPKERSNRATGAQSLQSIIVAE